MYSKTKQLLAGVWLLAGLVIIQLSIAWTDVPVILQHQGRLLSATGQPVTGTVDMTFRIYDNATSPSQVLWEDNYPVIVQGGFYSTLLGDTPGEPLSAAIFDGPDRWLGIKVGTDPEMTPRFKLASVPYAFKLATIDGAAGGEIKTPIIVRQGPNTAVAFGEPSKHWCFGVQLSDNAYELGKISDNLLAKEIVLRVNRANSKPTIELVNPSGEECRLGTSSSAGRLVVAGGNTIDNDDAEVVFCSAGDPLAPGALLAYTGGFQRLTILPGSNVGINEPLPDAQLHVRFPNNNWDGSDPWLRLSSPSSTRSGFSVIPELGDGVVLAFEGDMDFKATGGSRFKIFESGPEAIRANGRIKSLVGGFEFPDGTVMTTAVLAALGGGGTAGSLAKFTGLNTLGNSIITENAGNVEVNGNFKAVYMEGQSAYVTNLITGASPLDVVTVNGTMSCNAPVTCNGNVTLGDAATDNVTCNGTYSGTGPSTWSGTCTYSNTSTFNGPLVSNGNVIFGDNPADLLGFHGTANFTAPAAFFNRGVFSHGPSGPAISGTTTDATREAAVYVANYATEGTVVRIKNMADATVWSCDNEGDVTCRGMNASGSCTLGDSPLDVVTVNGTVGCNAPASFNAGTSFHSGGPGNKTVVVQAVDFQFEPLIEFQGPAGTAVASCDPNGVLRCNGLDAGHLSANMCTVAGPTLCNGGLTTTTLQCNTATVATDCDIANDCRIGSQLCVGAGSDCNGTYAADIAGECHASSFPTSSDERLKMNVETIAGAVDKVQKIRGVTFDWNETYEEMGRSTGHREMGVIAQEVEAVLPELVTTWGDESYRAVDYGRLTAVLIEAVKEQQKQIEELKTRLAAVEKSPERAELGK